jgi:hypothetical protein
LRLNSADLSLARSICPGVKSWRTRMSTATNYACFALANFSSSVTSFQPFMMPLLMRLE